MGGIKGWEWKNWRNMLGVDQEEDDVVFVESATLDSSHFNLYFIAVGDLLAERMDRCVC